MMTEVGSGSISQRYGSAPKRHGSPTLQKTGDKFKDTEWICSKYTSRQNENDIFWQSAQFRDAHNIYLGCGRDLQMIQDPTPKLGQ
jgi:hypothetical protein